MVLPSMMPYLITGKLNDDYNFYEGNEMKTEMLEEYYLTEVFNKTFEPAGTLADYLDNDWDEPRIIVIDNGLDMKRVAMLLEATRYPPEYAGGLVKVEWNYPGKYNRNTFSMRSLDTPVYKEIE